MKFSLAPLPEGIPTLSGKCTTLQVTNPPIDPLREGLVMSLEMRLGKRGNLLTPGPDSYAQLLLKSPVSTRSRHHFQL